MTKRQSFQLRLPYEIHKQASDRAWGERISLNQWIVDQIRDKLDIPTGPVFQQTAVLLSKQPYADGE